MFGLGRILPFRRREIDGREGYVYVANSDGGPMRRAVVGTTIRIPGGGPPWIVVDHAPTNATLAKWPGRLWKVRIIEPEKPKNQPYAYAGYTRANSVEVLREEGTSILFGVHGDEVVGVLEQAMLLTREKAAALATRRHPEASAAYDRLFRHWARTKNIPHEHHGDLDGTLKLGGRGSNSPIFEGLSVLYTVVFERAKSIDGDDAIESDDEAQWLAPPWRDAHSVLSDAALVLGAPEFASERDSDILLSGWTGMFGA